MIEPDRTSLKVIQKLFSTKSKVSMRGPIFWGF